MNKYQKSLNRLANIDLQTYPSIIGNDDFSPEDIPGPLYAGDCYDKDFENLQELVDKETPKKVIIEKTIDGDDCFCPNCKTSLFDVRKDAYKSFISRYCTWCGQHIDWRENDE